MAPEADLVRLGTTESKPGWCGGPRQGGRPVFAHPACVQRAQERYEAERARIAAQHDRATAALAAARVARSIGDLESCQAHLAAAALIMEEPTWT